MRLICKSESLALLYLYLRTVIAEKGKEIHGFLPVLYSEVMLCWHLMWVHDINQHFQNDQCWLRIITQSHANEETTHL